MSDKVWHNYHQFHMFDHVETSILRVHTWKVKHPERNHPRWSPKSWKVPFSRPEPSTKTPRIMEGSTSRAEPSTLRPETVEGSIPQSRTLHENAPHHGRFSIQSGTLHAEARNCGRFHSSELNPPRFRPESRTVRCKQNQPSTRRLDITDGPYLRSEPSMLKADFVDSSM